jgi:hypothetical protein
LVVVDRVRGIIVPVVEKGGGTEDTSVSSRVTLSDVLARISFKPPIIGDDGSESRHGSAIASRGTRHVGHLDTKVICRCVRCCVVAEGRNLRPDQGRQPGSYERTTRHDEKLNR